MLHSDDIPEKPKVEGTTKSIYGKWWKWWNTDSADVFEAGKVSDVAQECKMNYVYCSWPGQIFGRCCQMLLKEISTASNYTYSVSIF
jgi:hypothetical protein